MKTYKVHITEVEWDTDEPVSTLPTHDFQILVSANKISDDGSEVADALTEEFGYCINYAVYEVVRVYQ